MSEDRKKEVMNDIKHNFDIGMSHDETMRDLGFEKMTPDNPEAWQKYFYVEISGLPSLILEHPMDDKTLDVTADLLISAIQEYVKSRKEHGIVYKHDKE